MMAPTHKIPCVFFAKGTCRNGSSCSFLHGETSAVQNCGTLPRPILPIVGGPGPRTSHAIRQEEGHKYTQVCTFFLRGWCSRGDSCYFTHPTTPAPTEEIGPCVVPQEVYPRQQPRGSSEAITDSRARVTCTFFTSPSGCRNPSCPYLHNTNDQIVEELGVQESESTEDEDQDQEDDFTRSFSGALVSFDGIGGIFKVSLPTDFSRACITGLTPGTTAEMLAEILHDCALDIDVECIRMSTAPETNAFVIAEDPLFAQNLSLRLIEKKSHLSATVLPTDSRRLNCRKVHVSWHKATRTAWVNFGNGTIANRVAQRFTEGSYKILGQFVKSSTGRQSSGSARNPLAWTIVLSDVPGTATVNDVETAIKATFDRPRHIELGPTSYHTSNVEVSTEVRRLLEQHGQLENFHLSTGPSGRRVKAAAIFKAEDDSRLACSLNDRRLPSLQMGKLTVTLVQSAKAKIRTKFYLALKSRIDQESKIWKERQVTLRTYCVVSQPFTTLKIESSDAKELARTRKALDEILDGMVVKVGETALWTIAFNTNGGASLKLQKIETDLDVIIYRDKPKRQLHFYGPPEKFQQVVARVATMLEGDSSTSYEINLSSDQFSWMVRGGFKILQQNLGKSMAAFNVVSKTITVNGTRQQYEMASAIINGEMKTTAPAAIQDCSTSGSDCPICFCEADSPLQVSCKHVYCLGCFEDYCRSAASTSKDRFQVKCQGDGGTCSTVFSVKDLKEWLPSSVFEAMLKSSFEEYIRRRPQEFRYCPTPDCGYIYRCNLPASSQRPTYSCPNCFESVCTSCHERHGAYTCAEFKDIASGGYEALKRLKTQLNVKDCPRCSTSMEKTEGCNHMTCPGCNAHICWVCMAVFQTSGSCYDHMKKEHGGIGLGLEHWMN